MSFAPLVPKFRQRRTVSSDGEPSNSASQPSIGWMHQRFPTVKPSIVMGRASGDPAAEVRIESSTGRSSPNSATLAHNASAVLSCTILGYVAIDHWWCSSHSRLRRDGLSRFSLSPELARSRLPDAVEAKLSGADHARSTIRLAGPDFQGDDRSANFDRRRLVDVASLMRIVFFREHAYFRSAQRPPCSPRTRLAVCRAAGEGNDCPFAKLLSHVHRRGPMGSFGRMVD